MKPRHVAAVILLGCASAFAADSVPLTSSEELARLYTEDRADRNGGPGAKIDWPPPVWTAT
ncbi:hypothetical protein GJ697_01690 [Pseudoduganella sp. FT25W]|uniref:Uncharacterized protein n=1 Tax=Duganella alba TaxID=2666081 RepID=A0A6L5Q9R2_9BURK|nr:hypothetical protein [Duganella alba]MRX06543.1 hypothetical protein [Duganella alba]MRX14937.1 hypothetical protein [Duganella alba]